MAIVIEKPSVIKAAGNKEKIIKEFFGAVNSGNKNVSIAEMKSPDGWLEPGQTPGFDEYTIVLDGELQVDTKEKTHFIKAGQAILIQKGEWVRYSSPNADGAHYISVCIPAFSPDTVHRDE
ncbi:MAG: AraC family ligand binding domain-containing protein [Ignavibacteriae bacterium]|nr:AraC family ligand binding domain-containing protein [Ignavibacteriota bacterium]